jgi:hypothetical protein
MNMHRAVTLVLLFLCAGLAYPQSLDTTMTVDFSVRTTSPGGTYAPRNIGAIWVEDDNGQFLQTLERWANNRRQYLYTWNSRTGGNVVDGITGATRSSHTTHNLSWDFTNFSGDTVAPGNYVMWVEMTDRHSQGPVYSFSFPYMGSAETISPPEQTYFHNMELSYVLDILVGIDEGTAVQPENQMLLKNYPNPFNPGTWISYVMGTPAQIDLSVFDLQGRLVRELKHGEQIAGTHAIYWDGRDGSEASVPAGIYLCRLITNDEPQTMKMTLLK